MTDSLRRYFKTLHICSATTPLLVSDNARGSATSVTSTDDDENIHIDSLQSSSFSSKDDSRKICRWNSSSASQKKDDRAMHIPVRSTCCTLEDAL